jgi:hypothetical protein
MADTDTATAVANAVSEANKAAAAAQAAALAKAADEHKAAAAMVNKASGEALKAREEELAALEAELAKAKASASSAAAAASKEAAEGKAAAAAAAADAAAAAAVETARAQKTLSDRISAAEARAASADASAAAAAEALGSAQAEKAALSLACDARVAALEERLEAAEARSHGEMEELAALGEAELTGRQSTAKKRAKAAKADHPPTFSEKLAAGLAAKLKHAEEELFTRGAELVAEGEKTLALSTELKTLKERYVAARADVGDARATLLRGIAGEAAEVGRYKHVALAELLRLRLRAAGEDQTNAIPFSGTVRTLGGGGAAAAAAAGGAAGETVAAAGGAGAGEDEYGDEEFEAAAGAGGEAKPPPAAAAAPKTATQVEGQLALEKECERLRAKSRKLGARVTDLQAQLREMGEAVADVRLLKDKTHELANRQRAEKEQRQRFEGAARAANEKVVALSEHIEKLMVHLKHEAAAKAKVSERTTCSARDLLASAFSYFYYLLATNFLYSASALTPQLATSQKVNDLQRRTEREVALLKQRNAALGRRTGGRERAVDELREGTKILEDQLRLMDQKYVELRAKLDWTRASSAKEVKRVTAEANQLRAKWALLVDSGAVPSAEAELFGSNPASGAGGHGKKGGKKKGAGAGAGGGTRMPPLSNQQGDSANMPWADGKTTTLQIS